jgi:L-2-hydroxyglutarate oxidase LhgO
MEKFKIDCLVIGGGVSGVATASYLSKNFKNIYLIEKNNTLGQETSSRNSEVIHAGIYYKKNSLKSKFCLRGKELLYEYLDQKKIQYNKCGKLIVSSAAEEEGLEKLRINAEECGLDDLEFNNSIIKNYPFIKSHASLFSPSTGIFDSGSYISSLKLDFEERGGTILLGNQCLNIELEDKFFNVHIKDLNNNLDYIFQTKVLINAAGITSCNIANTIHEKEVFEVEFIKGEYYTYLGPETLNHLIYPMPSKDSLGIHATIDLGKGIRFGPSAFHVQDEDYSIDTDQKDSFYNSITSYWPEIEKQSLLPDYSGIRAKIKGDDDFVIDSKIFDNKIAINILSYISPGLTSSLALAENISSLLKNY